MPVPDTPRESQRQASDADGGSNAGSWLAEMEMLGHDLPAHERAHIAQLIRASLSHSGPLPTPNYLQQYEDVVKGLAERVARMPEKEQEHRHEFANDWLEKSDRLKSRGQIFAILAIVLILVFSSFLAWLGDTKMAGSVAIALVIGVVGIFVTGRYLDLRTAEKPPEI